MVTDRQFQSLADDFHSFKDEMHSFKDEMRSFKDEMRSFKDEVRGEFQKLGTYFEDLKTRLDAEREQYHHLVTKVDAIHDDMQIVKAELKHMKTHLRLASAPAPGV